LATESQAGLTVCAPNTGIAARWDFGLAETSTNRALPALSLPSPNLP
jgi:hypothetical protein